MSTGPTIITFEGRISIQAGSAPAAPTPTISITLSPLVRTVEQDAAVVYTVALVRQTFEGDVALAVTGLPTGVTGVFSPASLAGAATFSTLTLTAAVDADLGTDSFTVTGSGTDVADGVATGTLTVIAPITEASIAVVPVPTVRTIVQGGTATITLGYTRNNFPGAITSVISTLPTGVTVQSIDLNPTTANAALLTLAAAANADIGTSNITITISGANVTDDVETVSLTVAAPVTSGSFSVTISDPAGVSALSIPRSGDRVVYVGLDRVDNNSQISLAVSGLPTGVTATWPRGQTFGPTATSRVIGSAATKCRSFLGRIPRDKVDSAATAVAFVQTSTGINASTITSGTLTGLVAGGEVGAFITASGGGTMNAPAGWTLREELSPGDVPMFWFTRNTATTANETISPITFTRPAQNPRMICQLYALQPRTGETAALLGVAGTAVNAVNNQALVDMPAVNHRDVVVMFVGGGTSSPPAQQYDSRHRRIPVLLGGNGATGLMASAAVYAHENESRFVLHVASDATLVTNDAFTLTATDAASNEETVGGTVSVIAAVTPTGSQDFDSIPIAGALKDVTAGALKFTNGGVAVRVSGGTIALDPDDPNSPRFPAGDFTGAFSGERYLRFFYGPSVTHPRAEIYWETDPKAGPYVNSTAETWIEQKVFFPTNYKFPLNSVSKTKFGSFWNTVYNPTPDRAVVIFELWPWGSVDVDGDAKSFRLRMFMNGGFRDQFLCDRLLGDDDTFGAQKGRWSTVRTYIKFSSAIGEDDGHISMWIDDNMVLSADTEMWSASNAADTFRHIRAGYLFGEKSYGVSEDIVVGMDNFKIFNSDPKWWSN